MTTNKLRFQEELTRYLDLSSEDSKIFPDARAVITSFIFFGARAKKELTPQEKIEKFDEVMKDLTLVYSKYRWEYQIDRENIDNCTYTVLFYVYNKDAAKRIRQYLNSNYGEYISSTTIMY